MMVLVDTTIWSLALRRRTRDLDLRESRLVQEWAHLVTTRRAALAGPIRQEILSGIRREAAFANIQRLLNAFPYLEIVPSDYDRAAALFNTCRARGLSGTPIDLLLCAIADRLDVPIFTTDADFARYARLLRIRLHEL